MPPIGGIKLDFANQGHFQVSLGYPEVTQCLNGAIYAGDLDTGIGQQFKDTNQHPVVAKLVFFADSLFDWHRGERKQTVSSLALPVQKQRHLLALEQYRLIFFPIGVCHQLKEAPCFLKI